MSTALTLFLALLHVTAAYRQGKIQKASNHNNGEFLKSKENADFLQELKAARSSSSGVDGVLVQPALGRALQVGCLFDARTETPVSGYLWPLKDIQRNMQSILTSSTELSFAGDDLRSSKNNLLDIDGELSVAIPAAMNLKLEGAAGGYLKDYAVNNQVSRASVQYKIRTSSKEIDVFNKRLIPHHNAIASGLATHVVTRVTYGANAIAVFEKKKDKLSDKWKFKLEGKLSMDFGSNGSSGGLGAGVRMDDDVREEMNKLTVTMHSDVVPRDRALPVSYDEALQFLASMPTYIRGQGVPIEVTLYPLSKLGLGTGLAKLLHSIDKDALSRAAKLADQLDSSQRDIGDLLTIDPMGFLKWKRKVMELQNEMRAYSAGTLKRIGNIVAAIKQGDLLVKDLMNVINDHERSEFAAGALSKQITMLNDEVQNLRAVASGLKEANVKIAYYYSDYTAAALNTTVDQVWALIIAGDNPFRDYKTIKLVRNFATFAKKKREDEKNSDEVLKFVMIHYDSFEEAFDDPKLAKESRVHWYVNGKLKEESYDTPGLPKEGSKPRVVKDDISYREPVSAIVHLEWDPPSEMAYCDTIRYVVRHNWWERNGNEWLKKYGNSSWTQTNKTHLVIDGLTPGITYKFQVAQINCMGQGRWGKDSDDFTTGLIPPTLTVKDKDDNFVDKDFEGSWHLWGPTEPDQAFRHHLTRDRVKVTLVAKLLTQIEQVKFGDRPCTEMESEDNFQQSVTCWVPEQPISIFEAENTKAWVDVVVTDHEGHLVAEKITWTYNRVVGTWGDSKINPEKTAQYCNGGNQPGDHEYIAQAVEVCPERERLDVSIQQQDGLCLHAKKSQMSGYYDYVGTKQCKTESSRFGTQYATHWNINIYGEIEVAPDSIYEETWCMEAPDAGDSNIALLRRCDKKHRNPRQRWHQRRKGTRTAYYELVNEATSKCLKQTPTSDSCLQLVAYTGDSFEATNCEWSDWPSWSTCLGGCGVATKHRQRHIRVHPQHGGLPCEGEASESVSCEKATCFGV